MIKTLIALSEEHMGRILIIKLTYKLLKNIRDCAFRIIGLKTVGARALVVNNNQVLLIKHMFKTAGVRLKGW